MVTYRGPQYQPQRDPVSLWLSSVSVPSRPLSEFSINFACSPVSYESAPRFLLDGNKQPVPAKYHLVELVDVLGPTGSWKARCSAALAR